MAKHDFKTLVKRSLFLSKKESELFDLIPDVIWKGIFENNFNGNLALAERILFNKYKEVEKIDKPLVERQKDKIFGLDKGAKILSDALYEGKRVVFITDSDNDGSVSQSILMEFEKIIPQEMKSQIRVDFCQHTLKTRGLNLEMVKKVAQDEGWESDFDGLIVTADNGINNHDEVKAIRKEFPNLQILITDHHMPNENVVEEEEGYVQIVNPKYFPTPFFKEKNISGANTIGVVLKKAFSKIWSKTNENSEYPNEVKTALGNIDELGAWGNLIDYVESDIADLPLRPYVIEQIKKFGPLLNRVIALSSFVSLNNAEENLKAIERDIPEFDASWMMGKITEIEGLNAYARKLLDFHEKFGKDTSGIYTENNFYDMWAKWLSDDAPLKERINKNYLEQLRPLIINLSAIDNKDAFAELVRETAIQVFEDLSKIEREITQKMRETELIDRIKIDSKEGGKSTILMPKKASIDKIFNRRMLNKIYNEENNGFILLLGANDGKIVRGSMRSLFDISDIIENKRAIEDALGVDINIAGHERAAGFSISAREGKEITVELLEKLNVIINDKLTELTEIERTIPIPFVRVDFAASSLIEKIDEAIKANLSGMYGIPALLKLEGGKDKIFITDNETTEQIDLNELLKKKKYGYQSIKTNFDGGAFIVPVELLRSVVDGKYQKNLRLSYLNEGVFMASQVVDPKQVNQIVELKGGREKKEDLQKYLVETFKDDEPIKYSREDLKNLPYFRYNSYGETEFEQFEAVLLSLLEETKQDMFVVLDTEGTGLGKAPKCFNLGAVAVEPNPDSGQEISYQEYVDGLYRGNDGLMYYFNEELREEFRTTMRDKVDSFLLTPIEYSRRNEVVLASPSLLGKAKVVTNYKVDKDNDSVLLNRRLQGYAFTHLIKNNDFAITKEFEDLTGVDQRLVNELGKPAHIVDSLVTTWLENQKNKDGSQKKFIFSAHNLPYDKGVILSNLPKLNAMLDEHVLCDTAKIARSAKLAYDGTPVSHFQGVVGLSPLTYFYDSPYSDYSLTTFFDMASKGKSCFYPDKSGKILLRYNAEKDVLSVIDKEKKQEFELNETVDALRKVIDTTVETKDMLVAKALMEKQLAKKKPKKKKKDSEVENLSESEDGLEENQEIIKRLRVFMPNNAVQFSVQKMSTRAMVRNILLHNYGEGEYKVKRVELLNKETEYEDLLNWFQDRYHFDSDLDKNIEMYKSGLAKTPPEIRKRAVRMMEEIDLQVFGLRFLQTNKKIQAKFHDGWVYEKVLNMYEPPKGTKKVAQDIINQINYFTDLPDEKIKQVLKDTIAFKERFEIEHALVDEEHNNLRFTSKDGQGLADVAYEIALPQLLATMKFYNPYTGSFSNVVRRIIDNNIKDANLQIKLREQFNTEYARDSYSFKQMLAFSRNSASKSVKGAKELLKTGLAKDGELAVIRFNLSQDALTPDTAIYGVPKVKLSQKEIEEIGENLEIIAINEQVISSALASDKMDPEAKRALAEIASERRDFLEAEKAKIMEKMEYVEYSKKPLNIKKMIDLLSECFEGFPIDIPDALPVEPWLLEVAKDMLKIFKEVSSVTKNYEGYQCVVEKVEEYEKFVINRMSNAETFEVKESKKKKSKEEKVDEEESLLLAKQSIRSENFLPDLSIARRTPMKFFLKYAGPTQIGTYLLKKSSKFNSENEDVQDVEYKETDVKVEEVKKTKRAKMK